MPPEPSGQPVDALESPFGGVALPVLSIDTATLAAMYRDKCGADVSRLFSGVPRLRLYECAATTMRFWRPATVAGDEGFYRDLSRRWPAYYRTERWEYARARCHIPRWGRVLEVGCGQGFFLRSLEHQAGDSVGLELNGDAVAGRVTRFRVLQAGVDALVRSEPAAFDAVCSFQVLEHVADPAGFIRDCLACLRPGGLLILSTPNYAAPDHSLHRDPFDLPPHHLNHFLPESYRRIAALLGVEVLEVESQIDAVPVLALATADSDPAWKKCCKDWINGALRRVGGMRQVPGHTLLAVFRKPAGK